MCIPNRYRTLLLRVEPILVSGSMLDSSGIWVSRVYYDRDRLMKAWRKAVISLLRVALLNRRELGPLCRDRKDPQFTSFLNPTADVFTQETAPEDQLHALPWSACGPLAFASASVMYAPALVVPYHFVPSQW